MSFSSEIKNYLCSLNVKHKCCRSALVLGMLYPHSDFTDGQIRFVTDNEKCAQLFSHNIRSLFGENVDFETYERMSKHQENQIIHRAVFTAALTEMILQAYKCDPESLFECVNCKSVFARGLFISCGTVNDPENSYHLELSISDNEKCDLICTLFNDEGFEIKKTVRRSVCSLYVKKSEIIEDILTYIGASNFSIKIMDVKIVREIRNNENRKSNCDAANIFKSTGAAAVIIKIINRLIDDGRIDGLNDQLKTTAMLRVAHPEMSMSELAGVHEPPITKSGLSHRLSKISAYYDKCYGNEDN